jgi:hypothetical protein
MRSDGYTLARPMKTQSHSLASFIQRTDALYKRLRRLIKQYPEDHLQPDDRIFNRLLTADWRYWHNFIGPQEQRYVDAAAWISDLNRYHLELCEFFQYQLGAPNRVNQLAMNPHLRMSASQCLHQLQLQIQLLTRWKGEATDSAPADRAARLRKNLEVEVRRSGPKAVAAAAGVNADTLRDFMSEKTRLQEKTLRKLEKYANRRKSHK